MELFQDISSRTITEILRTDSGRDMGEPGSDDSYLNKSDVTLVKPIIVGGIIGANFINLVGYH